MNERELDTQTVVGRVSERLARRELLRRGGRWLGAFALVGTFAGKLADAAHAGSSWCYDVGCACVSGVCYYNGIQCPKRFGDCPTGGYCWTIGDCTYCDYTCNGTNCRCMKCNRPGEPEDVISMEGSVT